MLAMVWPFWVSARFANTGGAQTRYAQTVRAFPPVLAALLGHATRPGKTTEERMDILDEKKAENVTEYIILLHGRFTGSVFLAAGGARAICYCEKADVLIFGPTVSTRPTADILFGENLRETEHNLECSRYPPILSMW